MNILDCMINVISLIDMILEWVLISQGSITVIAAFRALRILRILKLARLLASFR